MLNLVSLSTQSLASCVNYFVWNCLTCFSNTKIGSVTSFSILFNFQGPVRLSLAADDLIILPQKRFFVKLFFSRLLNVLNLDASKFLGADRNFSASIGSFQRLRAEVSEVILCLSAWRSSIIPHLPPSVNTFRQVFSVFFAIHSGVRKSTRFECPPLRAGHLQRQLLLSLQPAQNGPFTSLAVMTGSRCGPVPDFSI